MSELLASTAIFAAPFLALLAAHALRQRALTRELRRHGYPLLDGRSRGKLPPPVSYRRP